jgi:hypothetical protein
MTKIIDDASETKEGAIGDSISTASIMFKGEIEIFPNQLLSYLDQGPVKAYAARTRVGNPAFVLLCERHLVPHIHNASKYYSLQNIGLPKLLGSGLVDWAPLRQQRYIFIYENKLGKPVAHSASALSMGLKPDVVLSTVIKNLVPVLKDMRDSDFVHGNIRLQNLYDGNGIGLERIMLGECLALPAGYMNSVLYETIERAAADPVARGIPTFEDDIYSFGALLAIMMRPVDPFPNMTVDELLQHKIEHGSFATLTGKERFSGAILELLRGLLHDDVKQRWTIDDILIWLDGRRVPSKQNTSLRPKANRPIDIDGHKFIRPEEVALYLAKAPASTARIVDNGDIRMWLNRSIQDKPLEEKVETSINIARSHGASGLTYDDRLSSYVGMALAPSFPILYRGLKIMPQGYGRALVDALINKKDPNPYIEIIQTQMASFWVNCFNKTGLDTTEILQNFETCRIFLRQTVVGYGIERCAYFMAPESPCLSESFKDYHVRAPEELVLAYEDMIQKGERPERFFDRHVVAFISIRDRSVIDPFLPDLNAPEEYRQILAALKIFSSIQQRSKLRSLPYIASSIIQNADVLINRFHDRDKRQKLRDQVSSLKDKGDLSRLLSLFDNAGLINEDMRQFRSMISNYIGLRKEHVKLEYDLENDPRFGFATGRRMAALVSGLLAGAGILLYLLFNSGG